MGANAQTTVPTFTAGEVLTAAQQNQSARTGVPVFASTATRDAGFGGSGEKTLAEGQLCYVEGTGLQSYNGTSWVTWGTAPSSGALTLISSTTIGSAVSSVTVSSAFSSTYDNYRIIISGGASSASTGLLTLQLGSTTSGYYYGGSGARWAAGTVDALGGSNAANFAYVGTGRPDGLGADISLVAPNLAKYTYASYWYDSGDSSVTVHGFLANTTQYTAFTIAAASGTLTGGTIKVYGYANS